VLFLLFCFYILFLKLIKFAYFFSYEQVDLREERTVRIISAASYPVVTFGPFGSPSEVLMSLSHAIGKFSIYSLSLHCCFCYLLRSNVHNLNVRVSPIDCSVHYVITIGLQVLCLCPRNGVWVTSNVDGATCLLKVYLRYYKAIRNIYSLFSHVKLFYTLLTCDWLFFSAR
jgi:hypothetical protein